VAHTFKGGDITTAVVACLCAAAAQSVPADEIRSRTEPYVPPSGVTLRTEVRVVEVPVVVRDDRFRAVAGLTRDDFEIYDNGKKQAISSFSVQSFAPHGEASVAAASKDAPRPRFLALCFDDLHLLPAALQPVKDAAERFVRTSLAPGDRVVVVRTSQSEDSQFTGDVPTLVAQIAKVTAFLQGIQDDSERCPAHFEPYEAYKIAAHMDPGGQVLNEKLAECLRCYGSKCPEGLITSAASAIWAHVRSSTVNSLGAIQGVVDGMAQLPGQRIILLTSGGFLTGTLDADVNRLMDKARRAEVVINGLDARGLYLDARAGMAYDGMGLLASGTGGTYFHNNNDMERGFRELGMVPETSYVLGFAPPGAADGTFHKLKVRLAARKGYSVEARLGYTALAANSKISKLDSEAMASDTIADLPASFTWEQWKGRVGITTIVHLDIGRLHFQPWEDRRTQKLTIVAVVLDKDGGFVAGQRSELQLSFRDATFRELSKTGFTTAMTVKAPPGSYRVRAVALDALEGKLSAASGAVEIK
jgi:VWFA-related protein